MGDNVHLRVARKRAKRDAAGNTAAVSGLAHGHGTTNRNAARSRRVRARKSLDQHRIESGDGS